MGMPCDGILISVEKSVFHPWHRSQLKRCDPQKFLYGNFCRIDSDPLLFSFCKAFPEPGILLSKEPLHSLFKLCWQIHKFSPFVFFIFQRLRPVAFRNHIQLFLKALQLFQIIRLINTVKLILYLDNLTFVGMLVKILNVVKNL